MSETLPPPIDVPRLAYVDGLRGVAALIVVTNHVRGALDGILPSPVYLGVASWQQALLWPFQFGSQMVYLFIMLSGFSLAHGELIRRKRGSKTSLREFFRRRAWRILPTYYVAIAASICIAAILASTKQFLGIKSPEIFHDVTLFGFLSHILFIHTGFQSWMFQIEPPLWSIATEVQLYLVFPLLIGLFSRLPWPLAAIIACAPAWLCWCLGWVPPLFGIIIFLDLLVWFVVGIAAAKIVLSWAEIPGKLLLCSAALCIAEGIYFGTGTWRDAPAIRIVWAAGFFFMLVGLYRSSETRWNLLAWAPSRNLGNWSYSLYVIHFPVVATIGMALTGLALPPFEKTLLATITSAVAAVIVARLLYLYVERPSLARIHHRQN